MASEFYFDLKQADIYRALKVAKHPSFKLANFFRRIFIILFIICLIACILLTFYFIFITSPIETYFAQRGDTEIIKVFEIYLIDVIKTFSLTFIYSNPICLRLLGLSMIFLCFGIASLILEKFFEYLKNPALKAPLSSIVKVRKKGIYERQKKDEMYIVGKHNLAEFLDFGSASAVSAAIKFAKKNKIPLNSSILFYFLIDKNPELNFVFNRALLLTQEIQKLLKAKLRQSQTHFRAKPDSSDYFVDFHDVILESLIIAFQKKRERVSTCDILLSLAKHNQTFKNFLTKNSLKPEDISNLCDWKTRIEQRIEQDKRFWDPKNLAKKGSLAKDWAMAYTITLDQYSVNWSKYMRYAHYEQVGHFSKIDQMEKILCRSQINNILLAGRPGVGKKNIVKALAQKSVFGLSSSPLNYKRIIELNLSGLVAQLESVEEVEAVLLKIFDECIFAGNVILVIDEFHNYFGTVNKAGAVNISAILGPFLGSPKFQIIAITSIAGLNQIERNASTASLFEKVKVPELSKKETLRVLENSSPRFENRHGVFISYSALKSAIQYSERYLEDIPFPKKALDLLDEVVVHTAKKRGNKIVVPKHVAEIITKKTEIPVGDVETKEKEKLLNLEKLIHQRIINQEEAVKEISASMRRARAEIKQRKKPIGTFLFLGPTGVGKTETSKALSEIYFGREDKMIRLDMSEFQTTEDIARLIGSTEQFGLLTSKVRRNPFSLILLDEIEKAHPNILNLFLQVLDEGHLTDGLGRGVNFRNCIIIATSNAGAAIIVRDLEEDTKMDLIKKDLMSMLFEKRMFRPEFINRFDAVVLFKPLTKRHLLGISALMLNKVRQGLKKKEIDFHITPALKTKIVELGYSPAFGAREMNRVIQNTVENVLAKAILSDQIKKGDRIEIEPPQSDDEEFKIIQIQEKIQTRKSPKIKIE
ncbi:ATP-dependent Clp protease ATP-binding subunit [Candidatus Parcubacteria bacterium]|nr:ATP-dependent Clp protease ATP-binding subunit [Candidatus Parcubacteria bacterium]